MAVFCLLDAGVAIQEDIAEMLGVSEGTVRRAMKRLRDREVITGTRRAGYVLAHVEPRADARNDAGQARADARNGGDEARADARSKRAPARGTPRARAGERLFQEISSNEDTPTPAAPDPARAIVDAVWKRRTHPPATPFVGIVKIARKLLAAGWPADQIETAMVAVPTISTGWVESELNKRNAPSARPAQPIDTDRGGQRGRIKL